MSSNKNKGHKTYSKNDSKAYAKATKTSKGCMFILIAGLLFLIVAGIISCVRFYSSHFSIASEVKKANDFTFSRITDNTHFAGSISRAFSCHSHSYDYYFDTDPESFSPYDNDFIYDDVDVSSNESHSKGINKINKSSKNSNAYKVQNGRPKYPYNSGPVMEPAMVGDNQLVIHQNFTVSYNNEHEQPDWVFYMLTREMTKGTATRTDDVFKADPYVRLFSADPYDYTNSGYDRGHLCPSGDMQYDEFAQAETFYMSNISPQKPAFNRGVWKGLEDKTRKWAALHDTIYIVTGPVLKKGLKTIGIINKVSVPEQFYKIVYSQRKSGQMIAFLLPNEKSNKKYSEFLVTVDEIEKITGIDFFPGLTNEDKLESTKGDLKWWN